MLEALDARDLPSVYIWTGMSDTNPGNSGNWMAQVSPGQPPPPALPDGADDDLYFNSFAFGSRDCVGLASPTGAFNSVHIQSGYTGTVTLGSGLSVATFELQSGALSQPASGTDLAVGTSFSWTGGTLNSSANLATVHISGASATIAPGASNTITTGSTLSFEDSATAGTSATVTAGTINLANGASLYLDTLSTLLTDTTSGNINFNQPAGQPAPAPSTFKGTWTIDGGDTSTLTSVVVVVGEVKVKDSSTLKVTAGTGNTASMGIANGTQGIITVQNDSTVQVSNGLFIGTGGLLQTVANSNVGFSQTDQRLTPAKISGNLELGGGTLTIDAGPNPHVWGKLAVTGNGTWTAGTINVSIDPTAANLKLDQLNFSGTFASTVTLGGNGQPVANSPAFNVIATAPAINQVWRGIITANGGITKTGPLPTANNGLTVTEEALVGGKVPGWDFQS